MNPGLEMKRFGQPETVLRLAGELQRTKVGLLDLQRTLDQQVSSTVPSNWDGSAASAFQEDWRARSKAISQAADRAGRLGMAMQTLGSELQQALAVFQAAEMAAAGAGCWFTDVFWVQPTTNPAAPGLQAEGIRAWQWAETARIGAARELDWMGSGVTNEFFQLLTRTFTGMQLGVNHLVDHPWQSIRTTVVDSLTALAKASYE